jgi:hypothetical protein
MKLHAALLAGFASLLLSAAAHAQGAPPDVVRLKDGSMYRGTISELVAGDHVVIVGVDGQTHRFEMKDVASAGPSAAPPAAPAPASPAVPTPVQMGTIAAPAQVSFQANEGDVQLQVRTGQAAIAGWGWGGRGATSFVGEVHSYQTLCTAPCTAVVPVGTHHLGLSAGGKAVVEAREPVVITGPGTLTGTYTSHYGTRVAGLLVVLVGAGVGSYLMFDSFSAAHTDCPTSTTGACTYTAGSLDGTKFAVGATAATLGALVGVIMMLTPDTAAISFAPVSTGLNVGPREMQRAPALNAQGLALQARF